MALSRHLFHLGTGLNDQFFPLFFATPSIPDGKRSTNVNRAKRPQIARSLWLLSPRVHSDLLLTVLKGNGFHFDPVQSCRRQTRKGFVFYGAPVSNFTSLGIDIQAQHCSAENAFDGAMVNRKKWAVQLKHVAQGRVKHTFQVLCVRVCVCVIGILFPCGNMSLGKCWIQFLPRPKMNSHRHTPR